MPTAIRVKRINLGMVNNCQVWQVRNADTDEVIGMDLASPDDLTF